MRVVVADGKERRVTEVALVEVGRGKASDFRIVAGDAHGVKVGALLQEVDHRDLPAADGAREAHQGLVPVEHHEDAVAAPVLRRRAPRLGAQVPAVLAGKTGDALVAGGRIGTDQQQDFVVVHGGSRM